VYDNAFRTQWEAFLRHVVAGTPYQGDLWSAARGVQLAELGLRSAREGRRIAVPPLEAP
jgi:predicted dehydrogenase